MSDDLRKLVADGETLGFEYHGQKFRGGHLQFFHAASGTRLTASSTPSDRHAWGNTRRDMERVAGRTLPRDQKGKYTFKKPVHLNTHRTAVEVQAGVEIERLVAQAHSMREKFRQLATTADRRGIGKARMLLHDYAHLRDALAEHHRVLDPIY